MTMIQGSEEATSVALARPGLSDQALIAFVESAGGARRGAGSAALRAARYHLESGGKRARAELALAAGAALRIPEQDNVAIAATVELLHNASLVFDDLQDRDTERRGTPAVWVKFGADVALCTGALLLSAAYGALSTLTHGSRIGPMVAHTHLQTSLLIHGQTADLAVANHDSTTISEYEAVAAEKSGVLFALPFELVLLYSGRPQAVSSATSIATSVAVGYQISDDIADFVADLGSDGSGPRLNYVILARGRGSVASALASAHARALDLLETAALDASGLPRACGAPLADFARRLASGLRQDLAIGG